MIKKLIVLSAALLVQACAVGPKYTPMTEETKTSVTKMEAYNLVIQDEVRPAVSLLNSSAGLGGGLIGAAIDSSVNDDRSASSQDIIEPLYNATWDLDYRKLIVKELNPMLVENFNLSNPKDSAEARLMYDKEVKQVVSELKEGEAFLLLSSFYQFREEFKMLQTTTVANLYLAPKGKKASASKPSYHNSFVYQSEHVGTGGADSVRLWADKGGELFKSKLNESLSQTRSMMTYDMQPIVAEACEGDIKVMVPNPYAPKATIKGAVLEQSDNSLFVRGQTGALYRVSSDSVETAKAKLCKDGKVKKA